MLMIIRLIFYVFSAMAKVPEMSSYAKRMTLLSGRIFGEITRPYEYKTMKIQRLFQNTPIENKQMIQRYFPPHPMLHFLTKVLRNYGLFRDEHADFQEEMLRYLKRRQV